MSLGYNFGATRGFEYPLEPIAADLAQQHQNSGIADIYPLNGGDGVEWARPVPPAAEGAGKLAVPKVVQAPKELQRA